MTREEYFDKIAKELEIGGDSEYGNRSYIKLAKALYDMPYEQFDFDDTYICENIIDEHAANDMTNGYSNVTVLEVLMWLAKKMEVRFKDACVLYPPSLRYIFLELISNLGYRFYYDEVFDTLKPVENFSKRKYDKNGKGGPFPIRHSKYDQRKVGIITQMETYLMEVHNV